MKRKEWQTCVAYESESMRSRSGQLDCGLRLHLHKSMEALRDSWVIYDLPRMRLALPPELVFRSVPSLAVRPIDVVFRGMIMESA